MLQILESPLLCSYKVLVRLQLHLHISRLTIQLPDTLRIVTRRLLLDLSVMPQLLLQLLILFNTWMIQILLGEELSCRSPASPLSA